MAEIEDVDGGGGALIRSPEERYRGGSRWLPQCRQDNNDVYSCPVLGCSQFAGRIMSRLKQVVLCGSA